MLKWLVLIGSLLIGALVVFRVVYAVMPARKLNPAWESASDLPPPSDFLYAMFPSDDTVPLCNGPGGEQVGVIQRAVTNSQQEIDTGGWVQVQDPSGLRWVQLSKLDYMPPSDAKLDYFAAFVAAYKARALGEHRDARIEFHSDSKGVTAARLHLRQEDHWQEYIYDVSSGRAMPREMYLVFGPGEALADVGRSAAALCSAAAFVMLVSVGSFLRVRALRG